MLGETRPSQTLANMNWRMMSGRRWKVLRGVVKKKGRETQEIAGTKGDTLARQTSPESEEPRTTKNLAATQDCPEEVPPPVENESNLYSNQQEKENQVPDKKGRKESKKSKSGHSKPKKDSKEEKELKSNVEEKTKANGTKKRKSILVELERVDEDWVKKNKRTEEQRGLTPKIQPRIQVNPTPGTPVQDEVTEETEEEDPMRPPLGAKVLESREPNKFLSMPQFRGSTTRNPMFEMSAGRPSFSKDVGEVPNPSREPQEKPSEQTEEAIPPPPAILETDITPEFRMLRADNSHHAMIMKEALQRISHQMERQEVLLQQIASTEDPPPFQDRIMLAGVGAQFLHLLGRKHSHGRGFSRSCNVC